MKSNDFPRPTPAEEADLFPFGPAQPDPENRRDAPVLLLRVSQEIWARGGKVWHFDKIDEPAGSVFRAEFGTCQFRVFAPMPGHQRTTEPQEKGSPCHVLTTLPALQTFLNSLENDGI